MNTEAIVLVVGLLAWWVAYKQSLALAFVLVYLPVYLLLPNYYTLPIDHFPDPQFCQCCIVPIGVGLFWKAFVKREWKISPMDFAVAAYLGWQVVCELYNGRNENMPDLIFDLATLAVFPYMAGKTLIEQTGLRVRFAKRYVWVLFLVCMISVYEFKMGVSLFRSSLAPFFPGQTPPWVTQLRWGFGRIAGPYGHAISMAVFIGIAYLLHRWLTLTGNWEPKFKWLGSLPFSKAQILTGGLVAGLFMTLSRGPWIGLVCGAVLAKVGWRENRRRALIRALLILTVAGVVLYAGGKAYLAGASAFEGAEEEASAAYRAILIGQYEDIVMQSPIFGWGRANWPVVQGMLSIDNNYLFVALGTGLVGLGLFIVMFFAGLWRIFASGFFRENLPPRERTLHFILMGILASIAISIGTTYISAQLYPIVFILLGWSETCVRMQPASSEVRVMAAPAHAGYMMRVVA